MKLNKYISFLMILVSVLACEDILEVPDISNQQITVLAPLDGATVNDNQVSFNWNALEDTDGYKVEVATPSFANASQFLVDSLFVRDTLGTIPTRLRVPLLNGNYQWRIKGVNSGFETDFTTHGFVVNGDANADLVAPNTPLLTAPTDASTTDETNITFTWSREDISGSAERDSIYIFTDENLDTLETKGLGSNKSFTTDLTANSYYWFAKAFDTAGNESADSDVFTFTIN